MKTSEALKIVKKHYLSRDNTEHAGQSYYICIAAGVACDEGRITTYNKHEIIDKIDSLLKGHASFEYWLRFYYGVPVLSWYSAGYCEYQTRLQVTRHAWVKSLIAEYKRKGD